MIFPWSLNDSKPPQVSRTLLSILVDLNNVVYSMVSTWCVIFKFSRPFTNHLEIVPSAPITVIITGIFIFNSLFSSLARSWYSSSFSFLILLGGLQERQGSLFGTRCGRLAEFRWSVCISKSQKILCVSFSSTNSGLSINHLFVWSNSNSLHNSQWIAFFTQLLLVLYYFCTNLLYSFIRLNVSSPSPRNLNLLFCSSVSFLR